MTVNRQVGWKKLVMISSGKHVQYNVICYLVIALMSKDTTIQNVLKASLRKSGMVTMLCGCVPEHG